MARLPAPSLSVPLQCLSRVFACMSDGLVAVYTLLEDLPVDGEVYLCSHTINKTVFGLKDSDPRQRPYPIRAMALVSGGSQVSRKPPSPFKSLGCYPSKTNQFHEVMSLNSLPSSSQDVLHKYGNILVFYENHFQGPI